MTQCLKGTEVPEEAASSKGSDKRRFTAVTSPPTSLTEAKLPKMKDLLMYQYRLFEEHSDGEITYVSDVFSGFAGIARSCDGKGLGQYCAGTWTQTMPHGLCWYRTSGLQNKWLTD